jgi:hypothetical protein
MTHYRYFPLTPRLEQILSSPVSTLRLTARAARCLESNGIRTVGPPNPAILWVRMRRKRKENRRDMAAKNYRKPKFLRRMLRRSHFAASTLLKICHSRPLLSTSCSSGENQCQNANDLKAR